MTSYIVGMIDKKTGTLTEVIVCSESHPTSRCHTFVMYSAQATLEETWLMLKTSPLFAWLDDFLTPSDNHVMRMQR